MTKQTIALCSEKLPPEGIKKLEETFKVYLLPPDKKLADPVCHHPDMILTVIGNKLICDGDYYRENIYFMKEMCDRLGLEAVLSEAPRGEKYPHDTGFNVLVTDRYIFGNLKYTAPEVLAAAKEIGLEAVNVKQGYTACSTLLLSDTAVTADRGILEAAKGRLPALEVEAGSVVLEPYDTGFIGGATAYLDGVLYTFGELQGFGELKALLRKKNITLCPLFEGKLTDFGGIKFI
ncbi:MAG: hypothetical protein E7660_05315 [Ruminococcaceae bacterium]|nr:hypothetical protein [Oscillospiraceae bacterium]